MDEDKMGIVVGIAIVFTAQDIAKKIFKNHELTSEMVSAKELLKLETRMVMSGLMAMVTDGKAREYHTTQYVEQLELINVIANKR